MIKMSQILALPLIVCGQFTSAEVINIYNWEQYLSDDLIATFEQETGHTIKQFYYDDETVRDALILTKKLNVLDLVLVGNSSLQHLGTKKLFLDVDNLNIPNAKYIDDQWEDECKGKGIVYSWGTYGIAYRTSVYPQGITSWSQLYGTKITSNEKRLINLHPIDTLGVALLALGYHPYTEEITQLKDAYELLNKVDRNVTEFSYGLTYAIEHGTNSDMTMTTSYSSDVYLLAENTKQDDWVYVVPDEGTILWIDCLSLPSKSAVKTATLEFLNFITEPKNAAINSEDMWFTTPISKAQEFTSDEYNSAPELFPSKDAIYKSYSYKPLTDKSLLLRARILKQLK